MSNYVNLTGENRYIQPSARPSIHRHTNCALGNGGTMGRFGLHSKQRKGNNSFSSKQEIDEVDNIISKFSNPARSETHRRNSLNTSHQSCTNDENDDLHLLSKSLPANFPSYLNCRDISEGWQTAHQTANISLESAKYSSDTDTIDKITESYINGSHEDSIPENDNNPHDTKNSNVICILTVFAVAIGIVYSLCKAPDVNYDENKFYSDMNILGDKYRISDDSILRVKSGISSAVARSDTSTFIFVYNSLNDNFNQNQFNELINEIAYTAAKYLRNDSTSVKYTVLDNSHLHNMETHEELLNKYRDDVTETGLMLVKDIDTVPSPLAMAFHYYCDEYNPLAKKSAIFFTLNVAKCSNTSVQKSMYGNIEKCLAKKWDGIPIDNIGPLLTRVVNIVVDVTSAF